MRRQRIRSIVTIILIAILTACSSTYAAETISGTIRAASNAQPLASIDVDVLDSTTGLSVTITGGKSDATGHFTATLPGPGSYVVRADANAASGFADQYYNGVFLKSQAQILAVGSGAALTNINFSLVSGVSVSGHVTSGASPLSGIDIDVFASNLEFLGSYPATTAVDGSYVVGALPAGSYFIRADPDETLDTQLFVTSFYGGSPTIAGATPIVVGSSPVSGINIPLTAGGTVRGVVRDLVSGVPLAGLDIDVFDMLKVAVAGQATTDAAGAYEFGAIAPGLYLVRVDPTLVQGYARTYYENVPGELGATPIGISAGVRTSNVDFLISHGGSISGTIRRASDAAVLAGIDLDLFDSTHKFLGAYSATSDALGNYQFGPLMPGSYYLRADPTVLQGYAEQFSNGKIDIGLADAIVVTASASTGGVDFSLVTAGAVAGTVRNSSSAPIAGVDLDLFDASGFRLRKGAVSAADGTYTMSSLTPGSYVVRADPTATLGLAREYFDDQPVIAAADLVSVAAATTTNGVDFALPTAATVFGRVLDDAGATVPKVRIELLPGSAPSTVVLEEAATSDTFGAFSVTRIPPGSYRLRATPDPSLSVPFYYGDTSDPGAASIVPLSEGQTEGGLDITLVGLDPPLQTAAQQACIGALNDNFARVAKAESRQVFGCLKARAAGTLAGTVEDCFLLDPKGKIDLALQATLLAETTSCSAELPDFGPFSATAVNDVGLQGEIDLVHKVFAPTANAVMFPTSAKSGSLSKCQLVGMRQTQRCRLSRIGTFNRCKRANLETGVARLPGSLEACLFDDASGKIAKSCDPVLGRLGILVATNCASSTSDLPVLFAACSSTSPGNLAACLSATAACRACADLAAVDDLGESCDAFDDGIHNNSCP